MKQKTMVFTLMVFLLLIAGCASSRESTNVEVPPPAPAVKPMTPDITIQFASLDISNPGKRIEKADIAMFADVLRREQIEVIALQGISRYPGLVSRVDIIDELAREAEMRNAFGETVTLSGRQYGNAVLSSYPIVSSENQQFDGIKSTGFEAALHAVVDAGTRNLVIVSTLLPEKATVEEQSKCMKSLAGIREMHAGDPVILFGNLPKSGVMRALGAFEDAQAAGDARVWYSAEGLKILGTRSVMSGLGRLTLVQFGVFRKPQP